MKNGSDYTYRFTGVESTALAMRAVLAMEPNNTQRIESIKQWLLLQRTQDGWENTKTTAQVFEVLLQEELMAKSKWPANFTLSATSAGKLLQEYAFTQANAYQPEKTFTVSMSDKPSSVELKKSGTGRMYYTKLLTCYRTLKPGDSVAGKAFPPGMKLTRQFYRVVPGPMKSDGSVHYRSQLISDGKVKAGETILMKVLVDSPVSVPYVMMDAALPSGAEVVQQSGEQADMEANQNSDDNGPKMEGDWSWPWWDHQDVLDDRIVFFGTTLPSGKSEFHVMLRMEIPGTLNVDPVTIEGMYTKKVRAYSPLDSLKVAE
jgi:hypothetical protein